VVDSAWHIAQRRMAAVQEGHPLAPGLGRPLGGGAVSPELDSVIARSLAEPRIVEGPLGATLARLEVELLRLAAALPTCPPDSLGRARALAEVLARPLPPLPVEEVIPPPPVLVAVEPVAIDSTLLPSAVNCGTALPGLDDPTRRTLQQLAISLSRYPTLRLEFRGAEGSNQPMLDSAYLADRGTDPRQVTIDRVTLPSEAGGPCTAITYIVPGDVPLRIVSAGSDAYVVPTRITFATNRTALDSAAGDRLARLAQFLRDFPAVQADLRGYADPRGSARANKALSDGRARSARGALLAAGIPGERVKETGVGVVIPPRPGATDEEYRTERRVEFHLRIPATYRLRVTAAGDEVVLERE
jgi:outer membrane protein OmpA-like peptidoglycan-associated protein